MFLSITLFTNIEMNNRLNAIAAANDSASQLFEKSTEIFPAAPAEVIDPLTKKKHPGYAQKSSNGRPSYYAEIGSKGTVEFVPARQE